MRQIIIIDSKWDGSYHLSWGRIEKTREVVGTLFESGGYNIFGDKLEPIKRNQYRERTILRSGDGIKTVQNKTELVNFLESLRSHGIEFKTVESDLIHSEVSL